MWFDREFRLYGRNYVTALAHNLTAAGEWQTNRYTQPARPGQLVVLWGTGLGAHREVGSAEVLLGDKRAPVVYAGPSECCGAGVDQVVFAVPAGIEGCHVPVKVRLLDDESESNSPVLAIGAPGDGPCSDPYGLPANLLDKLESAGTLDFGNIRGNARDPERVPTATELEYGATDPGQPWFFASFWVWRACNGNASAPGYALRSKAGTIGPFTESIRGSPGSRPFDAGVSLNLRGPHGLTQIVRRATHQAGGSVTLASMYRIASRLGEYLLDNGEGTSLIGPFGTHVYIAGCIL